MSMVSRLRRGLRLSVVLAFVIGAVVVGGAAVASHQFSDVATSNDFHDEIDWLVDSGVTGGCGSGKYCPKGTVTREQMAAFMYRLSHADRTGHFSCAGTTWEALDSDTTFDATDSLRFSTSNTGSNLYRCNVNIPSGAVVTEVLWSVNDSLDGTVSCELWRTNLVSTIGTETLMASAGTSGSAGNHTITDSSITAGTIDNANFAYFLQCELAEPDTTTGLFGASVEYTYEGLPAP
jgi:hypothetical protein